MTGNEIVYGKREYRKGKTGTSILDCTVNVIISLLFFCAAENFSSLQSWLVFAASSRESLPRAFSGYVFSEKRKNPWETRSHAAYVQAPDQAGDFVTRAPGPASRQGAALLCWKGSLSPRLLASGHREETTKASPGSLNRVALKCVFVCTLCVFIWIFTF